MDRQPGRRVLWEVSDGPPEWIATRVCFDPIQDGEWTVVRFAQAGWRAPAEFMNHGSTK